MSAPDVAVLDMLVIGLISFVLAGLLVAHNHAHVRMLERAIVHLMCQPSRLTARELAMAAHLMQSYGMGLPAPRTRPLQEPRSQRRLAPYHPRETPKLNMSDWDD